MVDGNTNLVELFRELNQFDFIALNQPATRNRRTIDSIGNIVSPLVACLTVLFIVCSVLRARKTVQNRRAARANSNRDEYVILVVVKLSSNAISHLKKFFFEL